MGSKNYVVGAEIEAFCTKCKIDRLHAIETLKSDGNINRVICRTCEGSHQFRLPHGEGGKKPRVATKRRKKGAAVFTDEDLTKAKPYSTDGAFEAGDVIQHKQFGPGRVLEARSGGKMEVGFEDGPKLLICRRRTAKK